MKLFGLISCFLSILFPALSSPGCGFGYNLDVGGSTFDQITADYNQSISRVTQNGFIRFHNESGRNALQFSAGLQKENVFFENYSDYMSAEGAINQYNVSGLIKREALKFAVIDQLQFGARPGKLVFSLNAGFFLEHTLEAARCTRNGDAIYLLDDEIVPNAVGGILGAEFRFGWFTIGYKAEKLFNDVLDHDYIIGQELNTENSTELRGIKMNPLMNHIYLGFSLDFF